MSFQADSTARSIAVPLVLLLPLLTGLALLAPAAANAAPGSIAGTVTATDGGAPIAEVEVCAWGLDGEEVDDFTCEESDALGEYAITVEPGDYKVEFWAYGGGYVGEYYEDVEFFSEATVVQVVDGGAETGIDAQLEGFAQISGVVEAAGGGSLGEIEVCLLIEGEWVRCTESESDGGYSLDSVWPGTYEVEFWDESGNYASQWWDDRSHWWEADSITVGKSEVETGIDADLSLGGRIQGTVTAAGSGLPLEEIYVCSIALPSNELSACTETGPGGLYSLRRLGTGTYKVVFSLDFGEWFFGEVEEEDGYRTQFFNGKPTLAAADPLNLVAPATISGVDASLVSTKVVPPPMAPPAQTAPPAIQKKKKAKKCRKGKKLKKVKGKKKCVKVHKQGKKHKKGKGKRAGRAQVSGGGIGFEHVGRVRLRS